MAETYIIHTANLEESREVQREIKTPFTTEKALAIFLLNSWFVGLMPLECIGDFLKNFHEDLYHEFVPDEEEEDDDDAIMDEEDESTLSAKSEPDWDDMEHDDKLRVYEVIKEGLGEAEQLSWFINELPKAKKYPYLCIKKGADTHWEVMIEMLKKGKMMF